LQEALARKNSCMPYKVKLKQFEGPLDLLLELIEKEKLDITNLSLTKVADEYLSYIEDRENITLDNLASFLSVASRLILIKSRALLPLLKFSEEEEEEIKDLEYQLAEYKKFKDLSKKIGKLYDSSIIIFSREGFWGVKGFFHPPKNINVFDLKKTFVEILSEIPTAEKLEQEVIGEIVTLEEKIKHLYGQLEKKAEASFLETVSDTQSKVEIIMSFLAMLEMVKRKIIQAEQGKLFEDIKIWTIKN